MNLEIQYITASNAYPRPHMNHPDQLRKMRKSLRNCKDLIKEITLVLNYSGFTLLKKKVRSSLHRKKRGDIVLQQGGQDAVLGV